jgi:hypothetical protein
MNFYTKFSENLKNQLLIAGLCALQSACGPGAASLSILPASQSRFQGSVANNKVDILWVIDNSGSMAPKQTTLANGFADFIQIFDTKGFDYRMAVVTTDLLAQDGDFQGVTKVLTPSTAGLAAAFQNNVQVGALGAANAQAIDVTLLALSNAKLTGNNTGFLRSDAHLAVIYLSDADDNDSTSSTSDLTTFLNTLKPQIFDVIARTYKNNYTLSAVVAPSFPDAGCTALYGAGTYERGTKFINLANSTNGSVASICNASFAAGLTSLSQRIAEAITEIPLSRAPDQSTIQVLFNGSVVAQDATNGWTYDSANQKIVFHGTAIPTDNTAISINYTPADIIR